MLEKMWLQWSAKEGGWWINLDMGQGNVETALLKQHITPDQVAQVLRYLANEVEY